MNNLDQDLWPPLEVWPCARTAPEKQMSEKWTHLLLYGVLIVVLSLSVYLHVFHLRTNGFHLMEACINQIHLEVLSFKHYVTDVTVSIFQKLRWWMRLLTFYLNITSQYVYSWSKSHLSHWTPICDVINICFLIPVYVFELWLQSTQLCFWATLSCVSQAQHHPHTLLHICQAWIKTKPVWHPPRVCAQLWGSGSHGAGSVLGTHGASWWSQQWCHPAGFPGQQPHPPLSVFVVEGEEKHIRVLF